MREESAMTRRDGAKIVIFKSVFWIFPHKFFIFNQKSFTRITLGIV